MEDDSCVQCLVGWWFIEDEWLCPCSISLKPLGQISSCGIITETNSNEIFKLYLPNLYQKCMISFRCIYRLNSGSGILFLNVTWLKARCLSRSSLPFQYHFYSLIAEGCQGAMQLFLKSWYWSLIAGYKFLVKWSFYHQFWACIQIHIVMAERIKECLLNVLKRMMKKIKS